VFKFLQMPAMLICFFATVVQAQEPVADPTRPLNFVGVPGAASNEQDAIQLTSILIASDRKVAIINGQSLRENQTLKGIGAVVKKIDADAVTLQQNGKVWRVALNNTAIRK
jgi:MSHA biogenesis protein MshK